jgi:membrane associated rhomboid family serine protease
MRPFTERLSRAITVLVVGLSLVFGFYVFVTPARDFFAMHLALGPGVFAGEVWQPVTALLVHIEPISFFFNIIGLWFVGATIERELGRGRFLALLFVPALVANLAMAGVTRALGSPEIMPPGLGTGVLGLFVAFGRLYNRTPARVLGSLVLEARVLAAILVGFALLADLARMALAPLAGDVVGIALAWALAARPGSGSRGSSQDTPGRAPPRRRFQVVEGGRKSKPDDGAGYLN